MKSFKFKFKPYVIVLLILTLVISLISLALNVYNLVTYFSLGGIKIISYFIICFATLIIGIYIVSLLVYSKYRFFDEFLICNLGLYKTKVKIKNINEIILFNDSNKLIIYFGEREFSVIVISKEEFEDFIANLLKLNPQIRFSTNASVKV